MIKNLSLFFLILSLTSCCLYKMPEEDDFSTVPLVNNPHVTKDPGNNLLPGMGK